MRKLIIIVVILLALGATAFYFGWIQIRLPENTYAVLFTKTGGWDESVTEPGEFVWRWERLIPTNCKIHTFTLQPYTAKVNSSGSLPSGDIYAQMLDPRPDFGFSADITVSFGIDPRSLPKLVSTAALTEDTFEAWQKETESAIAARTGAFIRERSVDVTAATSLTSMGESIIEDLTRYLERSFQDVEFRAIVVQDLKVPDFELYLTAKELFIDFSKKRKESYEAALSRITWTESRAEQHFQVLERYGELITRYPSLLDLLSLKGGELDTILEEIDGDSLPDELP
ncbi:MAG: hypothetical protein JW852_11610 [Spirochaetales bacterium]|nr:hypothetical protein [Spirochaetales bacterium]